MKNSLFSATESECLKKSPLLGSGLKNRAMNKNIHHSKAQDNIVQLRVMNKQKQRNSNGTKKTSESVQSENFDSRKPQDDSQLTSDAFIILRLNEFDVLEETYGRAVAKGLASLVTDRLQGCLRSVDALERINSNEFAIMITGVDSKPYIEKLVQRIENHCNGEYVCSDLKLHISVTAGVSIGSQPSTLYEEQLRYARIALRQAERKPTAPVQFFSPEMLDDMQQRAAIIFDLRQALKQHRFVLHYQPQYDAKTQETVAVEALIRLQGQDGQLIYPDRFIGLAEETGLILPIGHWVIQQACNQYRLWRDMDCAPRYIAVNVSAKQLADNSLIEIVDDAVTEAGIEYSNLELEITEQSLIKKIKLAENVLNELSAKGVRIALDDFGTGYSSLAYLDQLPLNVLKIDRFFLQQLDSNPRSEGLIKSIVYIAKQLDLAVVAEGVENHAQLEFIKSVGCDLGQGYGYCKPQDAETITSLLQPKAMKISMAI